MGKNNGKKKQTGGECSEGEVGQSNAEGNSSHREYDKDTEALIALAQELKETGNKLFQRRDYEGAMSKYEKAIKLLPEDHEDVSYLRSNMATCYMQLGVSEYPRAIQECNLALKVTPQYSRALSKRARCYEALNRLDLALKDADTVLKTDNNNFMASEILERVKKTLENRGLKVTDSIIELSPEFVEPPSASPALEVVTEKRRKMKKSKAMEKNSDEKTVEKNSWQKIDKKKVVQKFKQKETTKNIVAKKAENKVGVEEEITGGENVIKLVFGDDIRWAQLPLNCSLLHLREIIHDRFPSSRAVLTKYRDPEGDLVTITTDEELRWAETSAEQKGSVRLYVVEVNPEQDPFFKILMNKQVHKSREEVKVAVFKDVPQVKEPEKGSYYIDEWIVEFVQLFKKHVGLNSDTYLNLHELGMKVYSEAMEEAVTGEEAQDLFNRAAENFKVMTSLAMFNWGNVHVSRARKKVQVPDFFRESVPEQLKPAFEGARREYIRGGQKYEEALRMKPDFYEGLLALAQQQFELAKLSWYYALGSHVDLTTWHSTDVVQLYCKAEDNMNKGMQMWEEFEGHRLTQLSENKKVQSETQRTKLDMLFEDISAAEAAEQASNMRSQILLFWGIILYERSIMEYKIGLPVWEECLETSVEKFELAGASQSYIATMTKSHCANNDALDEPSFKEDEIVRVWNEMYEAIKWNTGVPSVRLDSILRRRVSKPCHV